MQNTTTEQQLQVLQALTDSFYRCNGLKPPVVNLRAKGASFAIKPPDTVLVNSKVLPHVFNGDLTPIDFLSVTAHETGHLKHRLLYNREIEALIVATLAGNYVAAHKLNKTSRRVFLKAGAIGVASVVLPTAALTFVGRQSEYSADKEAAILVGPETYAQALKKLQALGFDDIIVKNDLLIDHPTYENREKFVDRMPKESPPCNEAVDKKLFSR